MKPAGISEISICSISGNRPDTGCPVRNEYFIHGTEPGGKCDGFHGKLSNIREMVNRARETMQDKNATGLFKDEKQNEEKNENSTYENFFFDD